MVELSIRSGLVTEHDLVPVGPVNPRNEEVSNAAECEALQEQGEESADEHDPIVEFVSEPCGDGTAGWAVFGTTIKRYYLSGNSDCA